MVKLTPDVDSVYEISIVHPLVINSNKWKAILFVVQCIEAKINKQEVVFFSSFNTSSVLVYCIILK